MIKNIFLFACFDLNIIKLDFPDLSQPSQWYFYFLFLFLLLLLPLKEYIFCKT